MLKRYILLPAYNPLKKVPKSLLFVFAFDQLGFALLLPLLAHITLIPAYPLLPVDLSLIERIYLLSLILASFALFQLIGAPLLSRLLLQKGEKSIFSLSFTGLFFGYLISAISLYFWILPLFICSRALTGFFSVNRTLCLASFEKSSPSSKEKKLGFYAAMSLIESFGFIFAISLSIIIFSFHKETVRLVYLPFLLSSLIALLNLYLIRNVDFKITADPPKKRTVKVDLSFIFHFLLVFCWMSTLQFNSAYLEIEKKSSGLSISLSYLLVALLWIISSRFFFAPLLLSFSLHMVWRWGFFILSLLMISTYLIGGIFFYAMLLLIGSVIAAILWPASFYSQTAEGHRAACTRLGYLGSARSLALFVSPALLFYPLAENIAYLHLITGSAALLGFLLTFVREKAP